MDFNGPFSQSLDELVQRVLPSLVVIRNGRRHAGGGIVGRADGLILTSGHMIGRRPLLARLFDDRELESQILAHDPKVDLALLAVEAKDLTQLKAASNGSRIGEMAFAFGHPWGQRNTVSKGIISAKMRFRTRQGKELPVVRSDAPLAPGNSGGPLVNAGGELLGVNSMIMGGDQSIAIPVSVIERFVSKSVKRSKNR